MAGDILLDVPPQHVFYVLLLKSPWRQDLETLPTSEGDYKSTFHDELVAAVNGAACAKLRKEEREQMLRLENV